MNTVYILTLTLTLVSSVQAMKEYDNKLPPFPAELIRKIGLYYASSLLQSNWKQHKPIENSRHLKKLYFIFLPFFTTFEQREILRDIDEKISLLQKKDQNIPCSLLMLLNKRKQNHEQKLLAAEIFYPRYSCIDRLRANNIKSLQLDNDRVLHISNFVYMRNLIGLAQAAKHIIHQCVALNVVNNNVRIIRASDLQKFKNMRSCNLSKNNIKNINRAFARLPIVEEIILADNNIHELEKKEFIGNGSLKNIDLCGNHVRLLNGAFSQLSCLKFCDLSNNRISSLCHEEFLRTTNLQVLKLDGNSLTELSDGLFSALKQLKELHLNKNQLYAVSAQAFKGLLKLECLFIQDNILAKMNTMLKPLTNLRIFDAGYNVFSTLSVSEFDSCPKLKIVRLIKNEPSIVNQDQLQMAYPRTKFAF